MRTELLLGLGCTTTAALMLAVNRHGGVATMLAIGLAVQGVTYLAAPIVVAIAEHELRQADPQAPTGDSIHTLPARTGELQPVEG